MDHSTPSPPSVAGGFFLARPLLWLLGTTVLTALVYLPGLSGLFLFDDAPNLIGPFSLWLDGQISWQEIVFGNGSGLLGRPLSMVSFLANASISGLDPLPFKATNLAIHLVCGALIYALLSRLLARDACLSARAPMAALLVSAVWLLHPMQVSTVLYVVQRMAQLSALFMLLALIAFVLGRLAHERGLTRISISYLFLGVPAATVAAMLSKENGALVPLLCLVIELGYFRATTIKPRPRSVEIFFAMFLILPGAMIAVWYSLHTERVLSGYEGRLFTLTERLLSQPRVLFDYIGALLLPRGPMLGVYTDDFVVSRSLLDPPTTLFAILGVIALVGAAVCLRTRIPAFATGVGLYLAGHAMESTIFPLEMYFEHRNYLPSAGIFLALAGVSGWGWKHLPSKTEHPRARKLLTMGVIGLIAALSLATLARSAVWGSWPTLVEQGVSQHPNSLRAQLDYGQILMNDGKLEEVRQVVEKIASISNPAAHHFAAFQTLLLDCIEYGQAQPTSLARVADIAGARLQLAEVLAFKVVSDRLRVHDCKNLTRADMADLIVGIVDGAPQPDTLYQIWASRFEAAELYLRTGHAEKAQHQASLAWGTGAAEPTVGVFLATVYYLNGDLKRSRLTLEEVRRQIKPWDRRGQNLVAELELQLAVAESADLNANK